MQDTIKINTLFIEYIKNVHPSLVKENDHDILDNFINSHSYNAFIRHYHLSKTINVFTSVYKSDIKKAVDTLTKTFSQFKMK